MKSVEEGGEDWLENVEEADSGTSERRHRSVSMSRKSRIAISLYVLLLLSALASVDCKKKSKPSRKQDKAEEGPQDENDPNQAFLSYGNNPLLDAARDGKLELVQKIVNRVPGVFRDNRFSKWDYDDPEDYPDFRDKNDAGNTPLHLATWMGHTEVVRFLLEKGASVQVSNRGGNYPIHWAARHNDTTILELMIQRGADVKVADHNGFTPLHTCAYANAVDTCRILLDKGADIDAKSVKGYTAVCSAAEHHKTDAAVFLMERGADVTHVEDVNGNGPLDLCSGRAATQKYDGLPHQVKLVETLREYGARYFEERKRAKEERREAKRRRKEEKRKAEEEERRKREEEERKNKEADKAPASAEAGSTPGEL